MQSLKIGNESIFGVSGQNATTAKPHAAGMTIKLNTAVPNIVPIPMSSSDTNTPMTEVNNSGDDVPMAMNVAPAISEGIFNAS